jgi:hypothetical protein
MWPHKDLGWWGFVISIIALLGAYPLSLLANLTSPVLQNSWATRSRASVQKRISQLKEELAKMATVSEASEVDDFIMWRLELLNNALGLAVHLLLSSIYLAAVAFQPNVRTRIGFLFYFWFLMTILLNFALVYTATQGKSKEFRRMRSPRQRERLQKNIEILKAKL